MQSATHKASVSKKSLWGGRIISAVMVLFLLFDSGMKVMRLAPAMEATTRLGYPARLVVAVGIAELVCVVLYVIPRFDSGCDPADGLSGRSNRYPGAR